jgi:hypothetical protein
VDGLMERLPQLTHMFVCNTGSTACSFFDASVVRYPSSYTYSLDATHTLTPVPGHSPGTPTFSAIDISATMPEEGWSDYKYNGGVLGPNGKIYLVPWNADHVGELDPATRTFSAIDISATISSDWKYAGGVLGPNGKIYLVPQNADHVGELDPATRTFSAIDISATISSDGKYYGGVLGPNGKIYLVPRNADHVGEVVLGNQEPAYTVSGGVSEAWSALLSPHFNKF